MKVTVTRRAELDPAPTSSRPATPRSSSTARAPPSPRLAQRLGRSRRWSTAAHRSRWPGERGPARPRRRRLMVEGGGNVHTQFLTADLADELQLVVAPVLRRRLRAPAVRRRRAVPVEPGPARHAGRGSPDRRRRAAALRAVARFEEALGRSPMLHAAARQRRSARRSRCRCASPTATPRRPGVHLRRPGRRREHLALGLGDRAAPRRRRRRTPLVRPHSECLTGDVFGSQRCDCGPQLREAVERIAERRRLPALPAPGGPRHRPLRQARRLRAAGRGPGHLRGEPRPGLRARTSATTPPPRRCCTPSA